MSVSYTVCLLNSTACPPTQDSVFPAEDSVSPTLVSVFPTWDGVSIPLGPKASISPSGTGVVCVPDFCQQEEGRILNFEVNVEGQFRISNRGLALLEVLVGKHQRWFWTARPSKMRERNESARPFGD